MNLLNNIRYLGWLVLDRIHKDSVYQRLLKIDGIINDDTYYDNYVKAQLHELLTYSTKHVNFYQSYNTRQEYSLDDFPVINKNTIMSNPIDFQSDEYNHNNLHVMSTSGSTGRPFKITQNKEKRKQVLAELLYFTGLLGYRPGKKLFTYVT